MIIDSTEWPGLATAIERDYGRWWYVEYKSCQKILKKLKIESIQPAKSNSKRLSIARLEIKFIDEIEESFFILKYMGTHNATVI